MKVVESFMRVRSSRILNVKSQKSHSHFVPNPAYIHPFCFSLLCITALRADWTLVLKKASTANTEITQGLAGIISYAALWWCPKKEQGAFPLSIKQTHSGICLTLGRDAHMLFFFKKPICQLLTVSKMFQNMPILLYLCSTDRWPSLSWKRER